MQIKYTLMAVGSGQTSLGIKAANVGWDQISYLGWKSRKHAHQYYRLLTEIVELAATDVEEVFRKLIAYRKGTEDW